MNARKNKRTAEAEARARADDATDPLWGRAAFLALLGLSVGMLGIRFYAAQVVGFGDSEALYACYAARPQPAFLDHPALVGLVARVIGEGAIPTPLRVHAITSLVATLVPWIVFWTARAVGAARGPAALAGLVVAVIPETAVGLFALTPDLLLAPAWLGVLALAAVALRSAPSSNRSAAAFLGAGLLAGVACAAKVSGVLLFGALLSTYLTAAFSGAPGLREDAGSQRAGSPRAAARTLWPWAGLVAGLVVLAPIVLFEAKTGWPMLRHRFIDTQRDAGAGVVLRNLGALLGGQLAYLSPVFAFLAVIVARDLVRERSRDAISRLLFFSFAIPIVPLLAMCVWSPVAEPHWLAPAFLALPLHAARRVGEATLASKRTTVIALAIAALLTGTAHAWVLTPASARLLPESVDPKVDIASELHGWPIAIAAVKEQMATASTPFDPEGREVVVVGPHWTVCAQLQAGLPGVRVGCATPVPDDFDTWLPREEWRAAEHVLFVTDNRFPGDGAEQLPGHVVEAESRVRVLRGGRTTRVFQLYLYDRRAQGSL